MLRLLSLLQHQAEQAFLDKSLADLDEICIVHRQNDDGHSAHSSSSDEVGAVPAEMKCPFVAPWVEQFSELICARI
jgi:hypothetical protein